MNRRHMTGDHYGGTAVRATLLARAMDEILGTHRFSSRKLPLVMRAIAAMAWVSVKSAASRLRPRSCQWRVSTKVSSSPVSGR